jgi:hypothetical protein
LDFDNGLGYTVPTVQSKPSSPEPLSKFERDFCISKKERMQTNFFTTQTAPTITTDKVDLNNVMVETIEQNKSKEKSIFADSKFKDILQLSSIRRGMVGELFVQRISEMLGFQVEKCHKRTKDFDLKINGIYTEVKLCREREIGDTYTVNQLRDQVYKYVILVILRTKDVSIFTVKKETALLYAVPQHGGKSGTDTFAWSINSINDLRAKIGNYEGIRYFYEVYKTGKETI